MSEPDEEPRVPGGTRQAVVGAISLLAILNSGFLAFTAKGDPGDWTFLGLVCVLLSAISLTVLGWALWRALTLEDDLAPVYRVTHRWIGAAMLIGVASLYVYMLSQAWNPLPALGRWLNQHLS